MFVTLEKIKEMANDENERDEDIVVALQLGIFERLDRIVTLLEEKCQTK